VSSTEFCRCTIDRNQIIVEMSTEKCMAFCTRLEDVVHALCLIVLLRKKPASDNSSNRSYYTENGHKLRISGKENEDSDKIGE
jgi:hypothetical protein